MKNNLLIFEIALISCLRIIPKKRKAELFSLCAASLILSCHFLLIDIR